MKTAKLGKPLNIVAPENTFTRTPACQSGRLPSIPEDSPLSVPALIPMPPLASSLSSPSLGFYPKSGSELGTPLTLKSSSSPLAVASATNSPKWSMMDRLISRSKANVSLADTCPKPSVVLTGKGVGLAICDSQEAGLMKLRIVEGAVL